jgi:hypothetical protein
VGIPLLLLIPAFTLVLGTYISLEKALFEYELEDYRSAGACGAIAALSVCSAIICFVGAAIFHV